MVEKLIGLLAGFIIATISHLGYSGIVLLMAVESACIPLPSEIIMPFSGYLVFTGAMSLWAVATAGALGCVLGSLVAYALGARGGRPLIESYGKYVLISHHDLDLADRWFQRHGDITIFVRTPSPGGAHFHRLSRRRGAHVDGAVRRLYVRRIVHLVLGAGLDR